jgi:enoyl-CoA hydratase
MTDDNPLAFLDRMEWVIHREGQVATLRFEEVDKPIHEHIEFHVGTALALEELRWDDSIRVIVIAGRDDGSGVWNVGPRTRGEDLGQFNRPYNNLQHHSGPIGLRGPWSLSQGVERTFQALALIEKPVIAKWTGDAFGFGGNILFGCDIIVANEDVIYADGHLSVVGVSAGDGALAFLPLYLTPTKLKELLLLGDFWTARKLADLNVVNYALPASEVDAKVDYFVEQFLARPPRPLLRTKRAINKRLLEQWNLTMDYSTQAELCDMWETAAVGHKPDMTFRPNDATWNGYNTWMGGGELLDVYTDAV